MHLKHLGLWSFLAANLIAGCGSRQTAAADYSGTTYELVVIQKPDSVETYTRVERGVYDLFATAVQINHLTAKPFPVLPATLGAVRSTYRIRGRDRVVRQEMLAALDTSKNTPDQLCEVDITASRTLNVDLVVGMTHTSIGADKSVQTEDISDLRRAEGTPPARPTIVLASRVRITPAFPVQITEPQSLRTLEHPDASQFNAATHANDGERA